MGINLNSPSASPSANLVYDTGPQGSTVGMTKVGANTVSAAFEVQSTSGGILFPRMTSGQRAALPTLVDGMMLYDSTIGDFVQRIGGNWIPQHPASGFVYSSGQLSNANLIGMFAAGVQLLPAPGAGFMYIVHGFLLEAIYGGAAFINGGNIYLEYGVGGNSGILFQAAGVIRPQLLTAFAANQSSNSIGFLQEVPSANSNNAAVSITNSTAAFANGAGATANYQIWFSIVPVI